MPKGGRLERMHSHIARSIGGRNASRRAWAAMQSRGLAKRVGKHMHLTKRKSPRRRK